MRILLIMSLVLFSWSAVVTQAQSTATPKPKDLEFMTPQQKESWRLRQVMDWAKKTKPTQKELRFKIYEPVIAGCQKDYPVNQKMAELYNERADQAERNRQEKAALAHRNAAKAYYELAVQNTKIVKALIDGTDIDLNKAFAAILKLEQAILDYTGKAVKRDWIIPGEFATAGAKPTAAKPVPPAAPAQTPLK